MRSPIVLVLLLLGKLALAQEMVSGTNNPSPVKPVVSNPVPSEANSLAQNTRVIPFIRAGNLIVIKGIADTTEGNFILDTGAPGLILNLTYFRQYKQADTEGRGSVAGAVVGAVQTLVDKFSFGGLEFNRLDADMINLGHIEDKRNIKILGLIGVSFFKDTEMIIDYEKMVIHLHRISKKEATTYKSPMLDSGKYTMLNFDVLDNKIIAKVKLGERKMKFFIDTGAESNVLDSRLPNKVYENVTITGRSKVVGAGNKTIEGLFGNLKNLKVGDRDMGSLPFVITNLENACISEVCCIDGILGFNFLSVQKIGFNFIKGEMYLWK
ncbi:MAG: retroviral-like aspartic protease family protein [Bacteroidota bacterium]